MSARRWTAWLSLAAGLALGPVLAEAQRQPYLLLQGPSERQTYRFAAGERLEWRFVGEEEFFSARLVEAYPESQAVRVDDLLVPVDRIAAVRHPRRAQGLRAYLRIQGGINVAYSLGAVALSPDYRVPGARRAFALSAAAVGAVMHALGRIGRYATRELTEGGDYVLLAAGGDLRDGDDVRRN